MKDAIEAERRTQALRYDYRTIVTNSVRMQDVLREIDRITETDFPVLIHGESGTGKELIARAIHYNGRRASRSFVDVNCAAMTESLIESMLFAVAVPLMAQATQGYDVILRGGTVYDGTGSPGRLADVGIRGDRIAAVGDLKGAQADDFKRGLQIREGRRFDGDKIESTVDSLTTVAGTMGYAFVRVNPVLTPDRENKTVAVTFDIREGPKVFVERIEIKGNLRTRDEVIRREMRISEGDAFNAERIRISQRRLNNLDFRVAFGEAPQARHEPRCRKGWQCTDGERRPRFGRL